MPLAIPLLLLVLTAWSAQAAPFVPDSDNRVLERLPYQPTDPAQQRLRSLRAQLQVQPNNLGLAIELARRYVELGRTSGDPRYAGYAEAALAPWWSAAQPPTAVRLLRATLLQRQHRFDAALADLDAVLKAQPRHAQARLTRATVLQVQGAFDDARAECLALQPLTQELVSAACLANVDAANGRLRPGYAQLRAVLARHADATAGIRAWVLTGLAEMALRCAMVREAEEHFRQALLLDPEDSYLLGAYADFLLDQDRPVEAIDLLRERQRNDGLLLRYALALKARGSKDLAASVDELRSRYAASRLRGERVHLREEARFTLHLLQDAAGALALARQNWAVQKEPADLRILLEVANAAGDQAALASARAWLARTHLEDDQLTRLAATATHPQ